MTGEPDRSEPSPEATSLGLGIATNLTHFGDPRDVLHESEPDPNESIRKLGNCPDCGSIAHPPEELCPRMDR